MKLYQKRKDAPLAVLYVIACILALPFVLVAYMVELVINELRDLFNDFPGQVRAAYDDQLAQARYRRASRQAKRNNPKLEWD